MNYTFGMTIPNGEMQGTAIGHMPFGGTVRASDTRAAVGYIVDHPEIKRLLELNGLDGQQIAAAADPHVPTLVFMDTTEAGGTITLTLNPKFD